MQAVLASSTKDETALLVFVLQQSGLPTRTVAEIELDFDNWIEHPPIMILVAMPENKKPTVELVNAVRANSLAPLVVITDPILEDRQIRLYQTGADLVIQRPFSARLLVVQMRALLRRSAHLGPTELPDLSAGGITLNPVTRQVEMPERNRIHLTNLEFRLLHTLMVHAGHVLSTEYLVNAVWGYEAEGNRELVRGLIQRLRMKLEPDPHQPRYIQTEPGVGYWFYPSADQEIG